MWSLFRFCLRTSGVALVLATVAGFLGRLGWGFDLFAHFRLHYVALLGLVILLSLLVRRVLDALSFSVALVVNLAVVSSLFCDCGVGSEGTSTGGLTLVQFNIRVTNPRIDDITAMLRDVDPDLVLIHEVSRESFPILQGGLPNHRSVLVETRADPMGIALFVRNEPSRLRLISARFADPRRFCCPEVPCVEATLELDGRELRLFGMRATPPISAAMTEARDRRIGEVAKWAQEGSPAVVVGDFNATRWSLPLRTFARDANLFDAERGAGFHPTWPTGMSIQIGIDLLFYDRSLVLLERRIGEPLGSDHRPQIVLLGWRD